VQSGFPAATRSERLESIGIQGSTWDQAGGRALDKGGLWAQGASPADLQAFARAHAALLRHHDLQFDFTATPQLKPPGWLLWLGKALMALAPLLHVVFWVCVVLGAAAVLFFVVRELIALAHRRSPRRKAASPAPEPEWRPTRAKAQVLLDEADRLAAQGRFGEAVHVILFRSIDDIDGRWPNLVKPALTSRDIAMHQALPEAARRTFADIARVVERSFFGGAELGSDDFASCRRAYEAFALPARR
jgi:hypothetical protein